MLNLDIDVHWEAEIVGRNGMHVVNEATYCAEAHQCPPAFLYRSCTTTRPHLVAFATLNDT